MKKVLELIDFSAGYGSGDVIKNISLTLYAGEVTSLIGENGCGKTTLLRCAAGLMKGRGVYLRMGKRPSSVPPAKMPPSPSTCLSRSV